AGKLGGKLSKRWTGPWKVTELRGSNAAQLEKDGKQTVRNVASILPLGASWSPEEIRRGPVGGPSIEEEEKTEEEIEGEKIPATTRILETRPADDIDNKEIRRQFQESEDALREQASKDDKGQGDAKGKKR